jgi:D-sedoheptulose 7-phosphate isomerase
MEYFQDLSWLFKKIKVSNKEGRAIPLAKAFSRTVNLIFKQRKKGNKIILIGNGGSASIASHISTDFLKNTKTPALTFNDASLITCLSNDLGYEYIFAQPIEMLAKKGDILFAISSSGKSKNILHGVGKARQKGCFIVTLSGFKGNNPLKKLGDINFYVPSLSYGFVEIAHLAICHLLVDTIIDGVHIKRRN